MGRARLSGGSNLYDTDPTYFPRGPRRGRLVGKAETRYVQTLTAEERARHLAARNHPSGRPSYGGANRSSNIKREINLSVTHVTLCSTCGGSTPEIALLSRLYFPCTCL